MYGHVVGEQTMNKKAHERLSALKQRVDEYHMEVTNGFISYTYEDSFDGRCAKHAADGARAAYPRHNITAQIKPTVQGYFAEYLPF
jgi:hypothetical protein